MPRSRSTGRIAALTKVAAIQHEVACEGASVATADSTARVGRR